MLLLALALGLGAAIYVARAGFSGIRKDRERAEAKADETLAAAFDGSPQVMFKVTPATLSLEAVISGAHERGYGLAGQVSEETAWGAVHNLVFTKSP